MFFRHRNGNSSGHYTGLPVGLLALALAAMIATSCGFRPLHGRGGGGSAAELSRIEIAIIADRTGQKLRNLLLDQLSPGGAPAKPAYRLVVSIKEAKRNLAIRKDETATRANLTLGAKFVLLQNPGAKNLLSSSAITTASYNILESDFGTLSAEDEARDRAVRQLSDEIKNRVAIFLLRWRERSGGGRQ